MGRLTEEYSHRLYVNMNRDLEETEQWGKIPIPHLLYDYRISTCGNIAKFTSNGKILLKPSYDRRTYNFTIRLKKKDGSVVHTTVTNLMGITFLKQKDGYRFTTKNGIKTDMRLSNITQMTSEEILARNNRAKRKTIFKIDRNGEVVEIYTSTRECAKANNYTQPTIADRCAGKLKGIFATDGYAYCYEDNTMYYNRIMKEVTHGKNED